MEAVNRNRVMCKHLYFSNSNVNIIKSKNSTVQRDFRLEWMAVRMHRQYERKKQGKTFPRNNIFGVIIHLSNFL